MSLDSVRTSAPSPTLGATLPILTALSLSHCLNDLLQSLLPAIYPNLKQDLALNFAEIGLITLVFQVTASLLQPAVGMITDKRPQPYSLVVGMACSAIGLLLLSRSHTFALVLIAAGVIGMGSSIFHPESSRVARAASGGRFGFAQSFFQVGGNTGQAIGPLLAALIIAPFGQGAVAGAECLPRRLPGRVGPPEPRVGERRQRQLRPRGCVAVRARMDRNPELIVLQLPASREQRFFGLV